MFRAESSRAGRRKHGRARKLVQPTHWNTTVCRLKIPIYTAIRRRINRRPPIRLDRRNLHAARLRRALKVRVFHCPQLYTRLATCAVQEVPFEAVVDEKREILFSLEFTAFRENNCLSGINLPAGVYARSSLRQRRSSAVTHRQESERERDS